MTEQTGMAQLYTAQKRSAEGMVRAQNYIWSLSMAFPSTKSSYTQELGTSYTHVTGLDDGKSTQ